jgi:aminoglycoside phosphotransferase (APT) family kinase protein
MAGCGNNRAMRQDGPDLAAIRTVVDRLFPRTTPLTVSRVKEGVSTHVYRIERGAETFYLRVLPEEGASFVPEADVHRLLRVRGVKVPDVLYVEHCNEALGRSVMLTTAIAGCHLGHLRDQMSLHDILIEAGRDLAVINQMPVTGFGWITRDGSTATGLEAGHPTYRAFLSEYLDSALATLREQRCSADDIAAIRAILDRHDAWLDSDDARLAHGDFDVTHIYQENGRYAGIIDFGEMRGGTRWYDLGHFRMHAGETLPVRALPWLLDGYRDVTPLIDERRIAFTSLLIAIRALARLLARDARSIDHQWCLTAIRREVALLRA